MLPVTYTREIMPAKRSQIPTMEMAMGWPHKILRINSCHYMIAKLNNGVLGLFCAHCLG